MKGKFDVMKKRTICLFISIVIYLFTLTGCDIFNQNSEIDVNKDYNLELSKELNGKVYDATMSTISVEDENGDIYYFVINDDVKINADDGVVIDAPISITYKGNLEKTKDAQKVTVDEITVLPKEKNEEKKNTEEKIYSEKDLIEMIKSMSIEEKVGQMFIVRCPEKNAVEKALKYHLGGYILFAQDFKEKTKQMVIENIQSYQDVSDIKMFIAVDEEGGTVNRLSINKNFRAVPFWSPQELYNEGGWDLIISDTEEKSTLLKSLGINVNLAPVCDISEDPSDYIYNRTFGKNADETSKYVKTVVETMKFEGIGSVLKHFPGYGNNIDTHTGISYDKRNYNSFLNNDFKPFEAGVEAGADAILVSHNIVVAMDSQNPASLSKTIHDILREVLNFNGVIMTDDLYMDAINHYVDEEQAAVSAILAGNDLICCTNFETQIPAVINAVNNGIISEEQVDESVLRILNWKNKLGILKYN